MPLVETAVHLIQAYARNPQTPERRHASIVRARRTESETAREMTTITELDDDDELLCSVCVEPVCTPTTTLACAHVFHERCIATWFERKMTCPLCRTVETMCIECSDEVEDDDDVEDMPDLFSPDHPPLHEVTDDPPTIRCAHCCTAWHVTVNWRFYFLMQYGPDRCPDCVETIEY